MFSSFDTIQNNLKLLRKEKGLTQEEFGKIIRVSEQSIQKKESDSCKDSYTLQQVLEIADHFNLSLDVLAGKTIKKQLLLSDILAFFFSIYKHFPVKIVTDTSGTKFFDIEDGRETEQYSALGIAVLHRKFRESLSLWSSVACSNISEEKKALTLAAVEKAILEDTQIPPEDKDDFLNGCGLEVIKDSGTMF